MDAKLQQRPGAPPKDARQLRSRGALAAALLARFPSSLEPDDEADAERDCEPVPESRVHDQ